MVVPSHMHQRPWPASMKSCRYVQVQPCDASLQSLPADQWNDDWMQNTGYMISLKSLEVCRPDTELHVGVCMPAPQLLSSVISVRPEHPCMYEVNLKADMAQYMCVHTSFCTPCCRAQLFVCMWHDDPLCGNTGRLLLFITLEKF